MDERHHTFQGETINGNLFKIHKNAPYVHVVHFYAITGKLQSRPTYKLQANYSCCEKKLRKIDDQIKD